MMGYFGEETDPFRPGTPARYPLTSYLQWLEEVDECLVAWIGVDHLDLPSCDTYGMYCKEYTPIEAARVIVRPWVIATYGR